MIKLLFAGMLFAILWRDSSAQIVIASYDRNQPFYFCNGEPMMDAQKVDVVFANISQPFTDISIDSFHIKGDTAIFIGAAEYDTLKNTDVGLVTISSFYYQPKKIGDDSITLTAFYKGNSSSGTIICHSKVAPPIAFYGVTTDLQDLGGGVKVGSSNEVLKKDTLHDMIGSVPVRDTPINIHIFSVNDKIVIRTCDTRTIDRMYWSGDSSEIEIRGIPPLPYTMHSGSSLSMPFFITPKKIGTFPHYFIVHTTADDYLVWSFEYKVQGPNAVRNYTITSVLVDYDIFPNPASGFETSLHIITTVSSLGNLAVIDLYGNTVYHKENLVLSEGQTNVSLPINMLNSGTYLVLLNTESSSVCKKMVIKR